MNKALAKRIEDLAGELAVEQLEAILDDIRNSELRGPQLYNAITAVLKLHKVEMDPMLVADMQAQAVSTADRFGTPPPVHDDMNPLYKYN